jgi:hypothetical protein
LEVQTPLQVALAKRNPDVLAELLRTGGYRFDASMVAAIVELYKPEDFTSFERQAWREVRDEMKGWHDARQAVDQLEKRDMEFDKELSHPRATRFLKSPIWSLRKSKNK